MNRFKFFTFINNNKATVSAKLQLNVFREKNVSIAQIVKKKKKSFAMLFPRYLDLIFSAF